MKLDFLDDLTDNGKYPDADPGKLLRLYDFNRHEASRIKNLIGTEIILNQTDLDLSTLDFVESLNCTLRFKLSFQNIGISLPSDGKSFVCELSLEAYQTMEDIIRYFTDENYANGYNWLYHPKADKIDLLFSPKGSW
jgi:hypothetical protein